MPIYVDSISSNRQDISVRNQISRYVPDASPFAVLLMRAARQPVTSEKYFWYDSDVSAYWTQINNVGGYADNAVELVVDDATVFKKYDIVKNTRTAEQMRITVVDTANKKITVTRAYGVTTAAAINDNDYMLQLGNAMEERSNAPDASEAQPTEHWNVIQEIRTPFEGSDRSEKIKLKVNEGERTRLRRDKSLDHRLMLERIAIFGERKQDTTNRVTTTGGLLQYATSNVTDMGGTMTESLWESWCESWFKYGSQEKLLIASRRVLSIINGFSSNKLQTEVGQHTYGVRIRRYESAHGVVNIIPSQTLEKGYEGMAIGVDMKNISYRPLVGCDTHFSPDLQEKDLHGWKDEYWTVFGMEVRMEKTHAILTNALA
jgi:hypothetical protein